MSNNALDVLESLYTSSEAAIVCGVEPQTIVMWIRLGKLKGRKLGTVWVVHAEEIERLLAQRAYR